MSCGHAVILAALATGSQSQYAMIGPRGEPITLSAPHLDRKNAIMPMGPAELADRLGRWSAGRGPLYLLLAARLRRLVDEGELPAGTALPPDRTLASTLAVGRGTVVAAYERAESGGPDRPAPGSGTRVAGPSRPGPRETTNAPVFLHLLEPQDDDVILLACAAPASPPPTLLTAYERALPRLATVTSGIGYHPSGRTGSCAALSPTTTRAAAYVPTRSRS